MRQWQRGFSRLELGVTVIIAGLLAGGLLLVMERYQGDVERQAMDLVVRQIRTGLQLRLMDDLLNGRKDDVAQLSGSNPLALRGALADNYLGELPVPPAAEIRGWYFDTAKRELAYRPRSSAFPRQPGEGGELRWKLVPTASAERSVTLVQLGASFP